MINFAFSIKPSHLKRVVVSTNSIKESMKSILLIAFATLLFTLSAKGQNFAFIGENSYPSTENFTLQSDSDNELINELKLAFAKDDEKELIVVSSKLDTDKYITGKLIMYLDNGTVISCKDREINDNVNGVAKSAYYLTKEDLAKLKSSNLNTIRYQVECPMCGPFNSWEGTYSASNKGDSKIDFSTIISEFYGN